MTYAALAIAALALVVALLARGKAAGLAQAVEDARADARRVARNLSEEVERALAVQRELLSQVAAGTPPDREQILAGRLWKDVAGERARALVASGELEILDVRTPSETAHGVLPGAHLIPIDELERRVRELPRTRGVLAYCAGGGRSAAACEFLAGAGFTGLHNLEGGISAWNGPLEKPVRATPTE